MDPIVSKTSVAQKIKSKQLAHSMKFGSPKLRDLLRQKCKIRIKESRNEKFNNKRTLFGTVAEQNFVDSIIKEELSELNFDIDSQDRIYQELIDEAKQWRFDEFIDVDTNFLSSYSDEDVAAFFCPICQRTVLNAAIGYVFCTGCSLKLQCSEPIDRYQYNIQRRLVEHEKVCDRNLSFFAEPIDNVCGLSKLNMFCDACDFYAIS